MHQRYGFTKKGKARHAYIGHPPPRRASPALPILPAPACLLSRGPGPAPFHVLLYILRYDRQVQWNESRERRLFPGMTEHIRPQQHAAKIRWATCSSWSGGADARPKKGDWLARIYAQGGGPRAPTALHCTALRTLSRPVLSCVMIMASNVCGLMWQQRAYPRMHGRCFSGSVVGTSSIHVRPSVPIMGAQTARLTCV